MLTLNPFGRADRWLPAAVAAVCWALAAGGALLWWLHAPAGHAQPVATSEAGSAVAAGSPTALARALGHTQAASEPVGDAQRRFQLLGVVAGTSGQGAALLVVDGQPPQAFVQGQAVAEGWRVQRLSAGGVRLTAAGLAPLDLTVPAR